MSDLRSVGSGGSVGSVGSNMTDALTDVRAWLSRFVAVTDDLDLDLLTLWCAHTHVAAECYTSPRLVLNSVMPGAGKTTTLEHLSRLCFAPIQAASISSPALLARMLDKGMRTILIDEVDRSLDPKRPGVDELIAILNSGYKRGATRPVLVPAKGGSWDVAEMPTFAPVAMAGNAPNLADDTRSRCIRVLLMPDFEGRIEDSDWEEIEPDADLLATVLAAAMDAARDTVRTIRPELPAGCVGRVKEKWAPLARIAAVAGGPWPKIAAQLVARDLTEIEIEKEEGMMRVPPAVVLLRDIHETWNQDEVFVPSTVLLSRLIAHNPDYWGLSSNYGKTLTLQRMGRMLAQSAKVHSERLGDSPRGYRRHQFEQVWRSIGTPRNRTDGTDGTARTDGATA